MLSLFSSPPPPPLLLSSVIGHITVVDCSEFNALLGLCSVVGQNIPLVFFFFNFIYLFIYGCVGSSFLYEGFLQLRQAGATLHRGARASHCRGLSCCGAQAPDTQAQ